METAQPLRAVPQGRYARRDSGWQTLTGSGRSRRTHEDGEEHTGATIKHPKPGRWRKRAAKPPTGIDSCPYDLMTSFLAPRRGPGPIPDYLHEAADTRDTLHPANAEHRWQTQLSIGCNGRNNGRCRKSITGEIWRRNCRRQQPNCCLRGDGCPSSSFASCTTNGIGGDTTNDGGVVLT